MKKGEREKAMCTCGYNIHEEGARVSSLVNDLQTFFRTLEIRVVCGTDVKPIGDVEYRAASHATRHVSSAASGKIGTEALTAACVRETALANLSAAAGIHVLP